MKNTGIFCTDEEAERLHKMASQARSTPMISFGGPFPNPWKRVHEAVYKCALKHGLPEITGFYGLSEKGEFVTT